MSWPSDGKPRFIYRTVTGYPIGRSAETHGTPPTTTHMLMDRAFCHQVIYESPRPPTMVPLLLDLLNEPTTTWRGLDLCAKFRVGGKRGRLARDWMHRYRQRARVV